MQFGCIWKDAKESRTASLAAHCSIPAAGKHESGTGFPQSGIVFHRCWLQRETSPFCGAHGRLCAFFLQYRQLPLPQSRAAPEFGKRTAAEAIRFGRTTQAAPKRILPRREFSLFVCTPVMQIKWRLPKVLARNQPISERHCFAP